MTTTITSRTGAARGASPSDERSPSTRHLRLVASAGVGPSAAELRARAAHPAGKGLGSHRPAGPRRAGGPAPLRLTRRGRRVLRGGVVVLVLVLTAVAGLALARGARAADGPVANVVVHTHVVLPGETLWGIAHKVAPGDDPRDTVARIVEFNAMTSPAVQAGQRLALPPGLPRSR